MSYILDAIAKAEQERQQQEVPSAQILALPTGNLQQPRRTLPMLLFGALVLNAIVLTVWLQSDQTLFNWSSPAPTTITNQPDEPVIETLEPVTRDASADTGTSAIESVSGQTGLAASSQVTKDPAPVAETKQAEPLPETSGEDSTPDSNAILAPGPESTVEIESTASADPSLTAPQGAALDGTGDSKTEPEENSDGLIRIEPDSLATESASAQRLDSTSANPYGDGGQREVSSISELPNHIRKDIPKVVFSGHLYSGSPTSSLVFVDQGRAVTIGQQIVNGLFLHDITPTGVIVDFRGYLIEIGILQNWTLE